MNNTELTAQHSNISNETPKSAMICLAGDIPQVITESIQALMYYKNEIPDNLYILVTSGAKTNVKNLENEINKYFTDLKINKKNIKGIRVEEIQLKDEETGSIIEDIKTENHIQILEKYINKTIETIKSQNINKIYYCVASGRKVIASVLGYFVQLYGTENDLMFQVQLNYSDELKEKQKNKYWHPKEALTLVEIPFYRTNQPVLYKILNYITDNKLKQSFLNFYNSIVSPAVSKLLYGFNIYDHFVDHGLNHSLNILKILVDLLNPDNKNEISLTCEEVYILACAIMLHDIGMCGNKGNKRSEPGIVRKYHGLISYELLNPEAEKEQNKDSKKHSSNRNIHDTITEDGKNIELKHRLKEISLLCKYHQQSSRMRGKPQFDNNLKEETGTLEYDIKTILEINNDFECNHRTYKLAALLRVLDSFDVQQSRLFNVEVMKKQIDKNDQNKENLKQIIWQVFRSIIEKLNVSSENLNQTYENYFDNHFDDFLEYVNELNNEIKKSCDQGSKNKIDSQNLEKLIEQYKEIDIQEPQHYQKHLSIKSVILKNKKVILKPDLESEEKRIFTRIAQREIKNEISKLYDIFKKNKINFYDVIIEGYPGHEYEKKIQIDNIKRFEEIKQELTKCKNGDFIFTQLSQKVSENGFQLKKIDSSTTVTNCDHYYDASDNEHPLGILYEEGSRIRLRETSAIDNEKRIENTEKRICFKSSKNESEKYGNIEIEPIFYDDNVPEKLSSELLKKYFDLELLKKYFDLEYSKKCKIEVKRQLIIIKMESKNNKDRLWAYEVEVALDEITFFDAQNNKRGVDFELEIENTLATKEICDNIYEFIIDRFKAYNLKEISKNNSNKYKKCISIINNSLK
ncbi:MAG: CRISPR-associated ring nuclease [Candidatus Wallbacteria bacterium]